MSPLMAVALISTSGPSPSDGASLISSSELVSPLIDLASMKTFEPCFTPTSMSPEAVWSATSPWRTLRTSTSPDAVCTFKRGSASSIEMSPEAARTLPSPCEAAHLEIAGSRVHAKRPVDPRELDVPARRVDLSLTADMLELDVAGRGVDLRGAEVTASVDVGRCRRDLDIGSRRRGHPHPNSLRGTRGRGPSASRSHAHLVAVTPGSELDPGLLLELGARADARRWSRCPRRSRGRCLRSGPGCRA